MTKWPLELSWFLYISQYLLQADWVDKFDCSHPCIAALEISINSLHSVILTFLQFNLFSWAPLLSVIRSIYSIVFGIFHCFAGNSSKTWIKPKAIRKHQWLDTEQRRSCTSLSDYYSLSTSNVTEKKGGYLKLLQMNSSPVNWGSLAAYIMMKTNYKT